MSEKFCPFCGSTEVMASHEYDDKVDREYDIIFCTICLAQGPDALTSKDALELWDHRAKPVGYKIKPTQWIHIKDGLPDDDELVVVSVYCDTRLAVFYANSSTFEEHMTCEYLKPEKWLRLPPCEVDYE